jgi:hypothetical protein
LEGAYGYEGDAAQDTENDDDPATTEKDDERDFALYVETSLPDDLERDVSITMSLRR